MKTRIAIFLLLVVVFVSCGKEDQELQLGSAGWSVSRAVPSVYGHYAAFLGRRSGDVLSRLGATGDPATQISSRDVEALAFAWMPGAKSILLGYRDGIGPEVPTKFEIVSVAGKVERKLMVDVGQKTVDGLAVSPDGLSAIFPGMALGPGESSVVLWRIDLTSGHMTRIEIDDDSDYYGSPSFLDADHVVLSGGMFTQNAPGPNGWVGVLDLRSGQVQHLTAPNQTASDPSIAPGGNYIVYSSFPGNQRESAAIWAVARRGKPIPIRLMAVQGQRPVISADGRYVLVTDAGMPGDRGVIRVQPVPSSAPWLANK